ncbi:CRISPR-associated protein Cas4 [Alkalihalobacillus oceani]|uniref:CRISPR-associated exonuclease Cas4 n=1 Tax=Halalkalibacter oceani TaxID=1653776 RepID=A0A9X2DTC8_9BACI|nr:CRISPR-associated protein Cas4 [Halalkalibacter oceani]MCM3716326.1 CRISPR-associated protein Cas4 [Halalkalibacter oceani]MCM3761178.1 CRISPR-associated protein Cas4 [Halalkalibacter oceani]
MQQQSIGGVDIHYLSLCKRKLWLYKHGIQMENESDQVLQGSVLHESAYPRLEKREVLIDNEFKIDSIDGEFVREVKLSSRMRESDRLQMLFYLYQLQLRGVVKKGLISYTKERRTEEILLGPQEKLEIKAAIAEAYKVVEKQKPPGLKKLSYCKKCAYYSFCYAGEGDEDDA